MNAFSLLELSIVLVIIGLLAGGVMTGQSLIRAAELRAVTSEYQKWSTAMNAFRDKYQAIPGDMKNATTFWGLAGGTGADAACRAAAGTGTQTCNGNGDGIVTQNIDGYHYWRQLANAGLIEGTYSGVTGGAGAGDHVIGVNCPNSKVTNGGWGVESLGNYAGDTWTFATNFGNNDFVFGSYSANYSPWGAITTTTEAWNIDSKLDDGRPGLGKVTSFYPATCTEAPSIAANQMYLNPTVAVYSLSVSSKSCGLQFKW